MSFGRLLIVFVSGRASNGYEQAEMNFSVPPDLVKRRRRLPPFQINYPISNKCVILGANKDKPESKPICV